MRRASGGCHSFGESSAFLQVSAEGEPSGEISMALSTKRLPAPLSRTTPRGGPRTARTGGTSKTSASWIRLGQDGPTLCQDPTLRPQPESRSPLRSMRRLSRVRRGSTISGAMTRPKAPQKSMLGIATPIRSRHHQLWTVVGTGSSSPARLIDLAL